MAAQVLRVLGHPNGERIWLAVIDLGDSVERQVVFGGLRRLVGGEIVIAAPPGSRLPDGTKMRRRNFRGQSSFGMLCSSDEAGWTQNGWDEVAVLRRTVKPGVSLDTAGALWLGSGFEERIVYPTMGDPTGEFELISGPRTPDNGISLVAF